VNVVQFAAKIIAFFIRRYTQNFIHNEINNDNNKRILIYVT